MKTKPNIKYFRLKFNPLHETTATNGRQSLPHSQRTYRPGDTIHCLCDITLDGELDLIGDVLIKFVGVASVGWNEQHVWNDGQYEIKNIVDRQYLGSKTIFLKTEENTCISDGEYSIPFNVYLDPIEYSQNASSFEGKWGSIRYQIRGQIRDQTSADRKRSSLEVRFVAPVYSSANLKEKVFSQQIIKLNKYNIISPQAIEFSAFIKHLGQSLGQPVYLKYFVENESEKILFPNFSLAKVVTYSAQGKKKVGLEILERVECDAILARTVNQELLWMKVPKSLPLLPATLAIIQIEYKILAKLCVPLCRELEFEMPIVISDDRREYDNKSFVCD